MTEQRASANSGAVPKARDEIVTDALTLKGLAKALDALTWEGVPKDWGPTAALIRTITQQATEHFEDLAHQPETP